MTFESSGFHAFGIYGWCRSAVTRQFRAGGEVRVGEVFLFKIYLDWSVVVWVGRDPDGEGCLTVAWRRAHFSSDTRHIDRPLLR